MIDHTRQKVDSDSLLRFGPQEPTGFHTNEQECSRIHIAKTVNSEADYLREEVEFVNSEIVRSAIKTTAVFTEMDNRKCLRKDLFSRLTRFIRLLKAYPGAEEFEADDRRLSKALECWHNTLMKTSRRFDPKNRGTWIPYPEEFEERFGHYWNKTYARERNWMAIISQFVKSQSPVEELEVLKESLAARRIRFKDFEKFGLIVTWVMSHYDEASDGDFYLSQRDAGRMVSELAGVDVAAQDVERINSVGKSVLGKLVRLNIIDVIKKGEAWTAEKREGKATEYRWVGLKS